MLYIIATNEGQPRNAFGGRNFVKLGEVEAAGIAAAKSAAAKHSKHAIAMMPSEWEFFSNRANDARVKDAAQAEKGQPC